MYNPNSDRRLGANAPSLVHASIPPPASSRSATAFVAQFLLIGMAIVAGIALVMTAPLTVTAPLGFVFFAYLFGTLVLSAGERRRQRRRAGRGPGPSGMSRQRGTTTPVPEPDPASRIPSGVGALAAFSIGLLGAAFVAPEQLGAALAAIGLAGLFILRIFAMSAGWAPRGSAWAEPRPPSGVSRPAQIMCC